MVENDSRGDGVDVEVGDDGAEPDVGIFVGVLTDGFVGAIGGLAGTVVLLAFLFVAASLGAFDFGAFARLAGPLGGAVEGVGLTAVGYALFLVVGLVVWPLLLASLGSYLPGRRFAYKGAVFGIVLWTGFVVVFFEGAAGVALALYLALTLLGHVGYGFTLGAVLDYFSTRPETLV